MDFGGSLFEVASLRQNDRVFIIGFAAGCLSVNTDNVQQFKYGQFQVIEDKGIERGGCRLETGFGSINATIEDQLTELEKEIDRAFLSLGEEAE